MHQVNLDEITSCDTECNPRGKWVFFCFTEFEFIQRSHAMDWFRLCALTQMLVARWSVFQALRLC
jgi:hypothetical protein